MRAHSRNDHAPAADFSAGEHRAGGQVVILDERSNAGAFFLGLGLGVAAALLLAPQSGEDARRDLSRRAQDAGGRARRRAQGIVEAGRVAAAQARADLDRRIAETKAAYQASANQSSANQSSASQAVARQPAATPGPTSLPPEPAPGGPRAGVSSGGYESFDDDGLEG